MNIQNAIEEAAEIIRRNPHDGMAFTGAGISVESGIPPFRGAGGLWTRVDPSFIELDNFYAHPRECWKKIRELFYDHWGQARPNGAHLFLTELMEQGFLKGIVTQNIDCLHQRAGTPAEKVLEFHGTLDKLVCTGCSRRYDALPELIRPELPVCPHCRALLKPDFVFFSEGIPENTFRESFSLAGKVKWVLVIGTTGEVMPACEVPREAVRHGARIIEINPSPSAFTGDITGVYIQAGAGEACRALRQQLFGDRPL